MFMEKIWLKSYPPGVPAEVDVTEFASLNAIAEESFRKYAASPAYVQMGRTIDFAELDRQSQHFAAWLQNKAKMKKGDRLAIMLPNILQYPIAMLGALRAGLVVVNPNPLYTAPELEHQLKDSGAEAIIVLENFAHVVQKVIARTNVRIVIVTAVGEMLRFPKSWLVNFVVRRIRKQVPPWMLNGSLGFNAAIEAGARCKFSPVDAHADDVAFLQYTGGTTGVAKAAMLPHGNIVANALQARAWVRPAFPATPATLITALPLYHIFALTANCLLFLMLGLRNILIVNP